MSEYIYQKILERIHGRQTRANSAPFDEEEQALDIVEFDEEKPEKSEEIEKSNYRPLKDQEVIEVPKGEAAKLDPAAASPSILKMINDGSYDLAQRMLVSTKHKKFIREFWKSLGLKGKPLHLHADDFVRFEMYNRKVRANRMTGNKLGLPLVSIPMDVFAYIWKNSVILERNSLHVFMLSRNEIAYGMGLEVSSIAKSVKALENIGLIKRIGTSRRGPMSYTIVYEIADIDKFFSDHDLSIPKNYKIKDRIADFVVGKPQKKKKPKVNKQLKAAKENPFWGLFTDVADDKK